MISIPVVNGILALPLPPESRRGRQWFLRYMGSVPWATETAPSRPGVGIPVPSWAAVGVPVSFGAEFYSRAGKRTVLRYYGVITEVTPDRLVILPAESAEEACEATHGPGAQSVPPPDPWDDDPLA